MIVAGVGCRKGASVDDIIAVIDAVLLSAGLAQAELALIATATFKADERGIAAAASARGLPLTLIAQAELEAAGARAVTKSQRVLALTGVPSVAEAAALAAGGPNARLLGPRTALGPATCALAVLEQAP